MRHIMFAFRVNPKERAMIEKLAKHMRRTGSDAVRVLVIEAAERLEKEKQDSENK